MNQLDKRRKKEISTGKDISSDTVELMDLPEPILIHIMSYLEHDELRDVSSVSMKWKELAHSQVLWSQACLVLDEDDRDNPEEIKVFIQDILATPYLRTLSVDLCSPLRSKIEAALLATHCRISRLILTVDEYSLETLTFLRQHPELSFLILIDNATDDEFSYADDVAATIGAMAGHLALTYLNLGSSNLLSLPKIGLLLASPSLPGGKDPKLNPAEASTSSPVDCELQVRPGALDLRNVDDENCETCEFVKPDQPQGLQTLDLISFKDSLWTKWPTKPRDENLSALLRAHKHSLRRIKLPSMYDGFSLDVWMALAECSKLEVLSVVCDTDGSGLCTMLETMSPTLRHVTIAAPPSLSARRWATVLKTLCRRAPQLETLSIGCGDPSDSFPGFKPLQPVLVGRKGFAALRELWINDLGPVGREQFQELASMTTAKEELCLRKLHLEGCVHNPHDLPFRDCWERARDVQEARDFLPRCDISTSCDCTAPEDPSIDQLDLGEGCVCS